MIEPLWSTSVRSLNAPCTLDLLLRRTDRNASAGIALKVEFFDAYEITHGSILSGDPLRSTALGVTRDRAWAHVFAESDWLAVMLRIEGAAPGEGRQSGEHLVGRLTTGNTVRNLELTYVVDHDRRLRTPLDDGMIAVARVAFGGDANGSGVNQSAAAFLQRGLEDPARVRPEPKQVPAPTLPSEVPGAAPNPEPRQARGTPASDYRSSLGFTRLPKDERLKAELSEVHDLFGAKEIVATREVCKLEVRIAGLAVAVRLDLGTWPSSPPELTTDPERCHPVIGLHGSIHLPCLAWWHRTFSLSHALRALETEWCELPPWPISEDSLLRTVLARLRRRVRRWK